MRIISILLLLIVLHFNHIAFSQVVINEYSCANSTSGGDPDFFGEFEDWVEIYNPTGTALDLNGFYLSDKASNPTKFQIPGSIGIPAGGYLMVYASGRGVIAGGVEVHTSFKLTQTKHEKIILADPSGTIIDSLTIKNHQLLHSRGRTSDGSTEWGVFTNSTPGTANTGVFQEYASTPILSVFPGFYPSAQSVSITTPDSNVDIYYTTDGSEPTTSSALYSGAINIATTTVLRAKAFSTDPSILPSFIETNTYFINSPHTVPVISISGDDLLTLLNGTQIEPFGALEFFDRTGVMQTEVTGEFNKHGNDSWAYDQRGLDFISRDQHGYNNALHHQLFHHKSRDEFQRIILKPGASDNYPFENGGAHIRDPYVQTLSQLGKLKLDERSYDACILYVNGQYWGVYETREKVDDNDFTDYYYKQDEKYKSSPEYIQFLKTWGGTWEKFGAPNAQNDWNDLLNFITTNNMAIPANFDYVDSLYNWKSLVDYFCLNSYIVNKDWLNWNTAWWRGIDPTGDKKKWRYTLWDMDAVFGHYVNYTGIPDTSPNAGPCDAENLPDPGGEGHTVIMQELLNNPIFEQYYISRYIDLGNTVFSCDNMIPLLDSLVGMIAPEMPGQIARWGGSMAEWQQNVQDMRDFIITRCVTVDDGLVDCYNLSGPYPVKFNVNPAGAGEIEINSTTPTNYVFEGDYFGGIDILLNANSNTGYTFSHWEIFNHTLDSALTNDKNSLQITQSDSIIAHFIVEDSTYIAFDVFPVGSGDIDIDGFMPAGYVYSDYYPTLSTIDLTAIPQPGYVFDYWESLSTSFTPDSLNPTVQITADLADSIVAHFIILETFDIVYNVNPILGGDISVNTVIPPTYPDYQNYTTNDLVTLVAIPQMGYIFDHWESSVLGFNPDEFTANATITVTSDDSIVAHFLYIDTFDITFNVSPIGAGNVEANAFIPPLYPYTERYITNTAINLFEYELLPETYSFDHWESRNHNILPSSSSALANFNVLSDDTIIAVYIEIPIPPKQGAQFPGAFSPNGDGNNDILYVYGGQIETISVSIYNRWGELVWETDDETEGWDGTYEGKEASAGVYVYKMKVSYWEGDFETKSGNITLIR
ncbi:T9SS type B sorting domain-containing protein [Vicingus serpentipes]|uniref:T9SS type B sorting domain-containing protein n=1 Tax=Vicingus serpentipes TaxID=1926625 RepID=A0A5C6RYM0_9FLAO|nr:CotH kinase family protein [Vicingus serpentipes]TXB67184.1 T9SS type B sorting domain-containing protein [Vicingus serpentipes]